MNEPNHQAAFRCSAVILSLLLCLAWSWPAPAAEGDEARIALCESCHGADGDGRPIGPEIPILAGQEFYYLYVQLKDYKSGSRSNAIMSAIAAELSKEQMQALAKHFSEQEWPRMGFPASEEEIQVAKNATGAGFCTQCHLGKYQGNSRIPRLAGQQPVYLNQTMLDFKNKVRLNSAAKGSLIGGYDDAVIEAMANFLANY